MAMFALHGDGVSFGIVIGQAKFADQQDFLIPDYLIEKAQIEQEKQRLLDAVEAVKSQLFSNMQILNEQEQSELILFFNMHITMLDDPALLKQAYSSIQQKRVNAQQAVLQQQYYWFDKFAEFEDAYLRSKLNDTKQILHLIQAQLSIKDDVRLDEKQDAFIHSQDILIADDITPSDAIALRQSSIKAFLTRYGSVVSHTAILAKSMHIPAIVGLQDGVNTIRHGDCIIVDGKRGVVIVNPDDTTLLTYTKRQEKINKRSLNNAKWHQVPGITLDAQKITLCANLDMKEDVHLVLQNRAEGIGLLRTEMMFLQKSQWPDEEYQYQYYSQIIKQCAMPVTIRTFDIGADKALKSVSQSVALNPALGLRAVRLGLRYEEHLRTQLRAILRAGCHGKIKILLPMVSNVTELKQIRRILDDISQEMNEKLIDFSADYELGVMVEVPATALNIDLFAPYVDFFSIGTNDLIQYLLAIDRGDDDVNYLYEPLHPAVLRMLKIIVDTAKAYDKPVSMCGEMASNPLYTPFLLWLGLTEFSMEPGAILEVKKVICMTDISRLDQDFNDLFNGPQIESVKVYLQQLASKYE